MRTELYALEREIERLREQREKQFLALNLFERCVQIVKKLGETKADWLVYRESDLDIHYYRNTDTVVVCYRGERVLKAELTSYGINLECYRPGKWLGQLLELSERLKREGEEEEYQRRKEKLLEELSKWEAIEE